MGSVKVSRLGREDIYEVEYFKLHQFLTVNYPDVLDEYEQYERDRRIGDGKKKNTKK